MKTYYEQVEERKTACQTKEDWQEFAEWLVGEVYEKNASSLYMEEAILEIYGQTGLDKLTDLAIELEDKYLPAEISMHMFGYKNEQMMPVTKEKAIELLDDGREVFMLFSDNTERPISHEAQIANHSGLFGVTYEELERIARDNGAEK